MLVQRLDDAIAKTLQDCHGWMTEDGMAAGSPVWMNAATDKRAKEIEAMERETEDRWLQEHAMIDDDGRARCGFHFCHKLFKDSNYLRKHLLKKHGEFLRAEQAKCHDEFMMEEWDSCTCRPVPDILVDCGMQFGWVATTVTGQIPNCADPEPDLWKREEDRRKMEQEQLARRQEERQAREREAAAAHRALTFVDMDDMKEEKVDISFDNIEMILPSNTATNATATGNTATGTKKKKKKRKLL